MNLLTAAAAEPDSMARASELLDLITSPTALATGVLLVFSRAQLAKNEDGIERPQTVWAILSALGATVICVVIVGVMTPLASRVVFTNDGGVETRLLVYGLTYLVAIGTAIYAGWGLREAVKDYRKGAEAGWPS